MQRDVGIRMTGELARMRDLDAAEPDAIAAGIEGMDVVADTGADIAQGSLCVALGAGEIVSGGHFDVPCLALENRNLQARPFDQRAVVGEIIAARRRGAPVRVEEE